MNWTREQRIAERVLVSFAGPWHVAGTETQRVRILTEAGKALEPVIADLEREAQRRVDINPT